ncbi:bifunctional alpha,alpha-trehalose-phosphate synthase (UDP-forming)/trehalose-phosphatase [Flavobacterium sp. JP2137]|uniref:bifunctional alpha,alpha-trehalose-phosphate synthase (UDP-forming)/trehalose-phosphatase n=1 Tax=Flavobacterium sp. JP2137 TaxID=3414510 RepID=UPI003D2FC0AC
MKIDTLIVSNRLPITIVLKNNTFEIIPSTGGLVSGLANLLSRPDTFWMGWVGCEVADPALQALITDELWKKKLIPVFLDKDLAVTYYNNFCNEIIWPLCHYEPTLANYQEKGWLAYKEVNNIFCNHINSLASAAHIWIQDYHLLLLPELLRIKNEQVNSSFFLHIPFPIKEIFMQNPWYLELLNGLLGANSIGFHTHKDRENFLNTAYFNGLLQADKNDTFIYNSRVIDISYCPLGIDMLSFKKALDSDPYKFKFLHLKEVFKNLKVVLSVDRMDYSKGITERLEAVGLFLKHYPEHLTRVSFVMILVPSREDIPAYGNLRETVNATVARINSKYGSPSWKPIHFFSTSFCQEELVAFYRFAQVCLVTSLRDGMNLVAKEYIACQQQGDGVLILSKHAGAAVQLQDAILINPYNTTATAAAINTALGMVGIEKLARMKSLFQSIEQFDHHRWNSHFEERRRRFDIEEKKISKKPLELVGNRLQTIKLKYFRAAKRLFLLDYDGTLVPFKPHPKNSVPSQCLLDCLTKLAQNPANIVVIISGRNKEFLEKYLSNKNVFLVSNHGLSGTYPDAQWKKYTHAVAHWKSEVVKLFHLFSLPGTIIEDKDNSVAWHYRKVSFAGIIEWKNNLIKALEYMTKNYNCEILQGDCVLEIKPLHYSKGSISQRIISEIQPDFIMAVGDDVTDETIFNILDQEQVSVKIGDKQTKAKYFIKCQTQVIPLIDSISNYR